MQTPRIVITPGEPAGIGPDLVLALAMNEHPAELVAVADPELLRDRAERLGLDVELQPCDVAAPASRHTPGTLLVLPARLRARCRPGCLDAENSDYVLSTLRLAAGACLKGDAAAMVTAPVQKSVIRDAGHNFSGHTEFLAELTNSEQVVMLLVCEGLRVALATTHLPLSEVPGAISRDGLGAVIRVLQRGLQERFGIPQPNIAVLGLNPHAGESGHLGREEIEVITPVLEDLRQQGLALMGPLPADTAFTPRVLDHCDAVLAMYHDQGLPVLKYAGFGAAVNVTLGLPIIRTSVDHGTALDLAGTGKADPGSLNSAVRLAIELAAITDSQVP